MPQRRARIALTVLGSAATAFGLVNADLVNGKKLEA
jgi:hypothetical protein